MRSSVDPPRGHCLPSVLVFRRVAGRGPRTALGALALALAILLPGAPAPARPGASSPGVALAAPPSEVLAAAQAPTMVRIGGQASTLSDAGIYLAEALGYFREESIQNDRQVMQSGVQALAPLATSQIEVSAFAPSAALLNGLSRGIAVKIVADKGREGPGFAFQSVVMRRALVDSGSLQDGRDLRGRRLGMPATGNPLEASLAAGLAQYGLTMADVQIELLGFPDMLPAIANGAIDGGLIVEPLATQSVPLGGVLWKPVWEFYPDQQVAAIMYGPALLEANPDLGRRWMLAYVRGLRAYNAAFAGDAAARRDAVAVLAAATRIEPALVEEIAAGGRLAGLHPDGRVNVEALRAASAYWRQSGSQIVDIAVDQFVDSQFVDYAAQVLGPYRP
jgi:NitT/TauT family transport system substrate-binding protein